MSDRLRFEVAGWLEGTDGSAQDRATLGELKISRGGAELCKLVDHLSQSTRDHARVSIHRLCLWLASNWWRLRWEPRKPERERPNWRLAHALGAAGGGYRWPPLVFESDGQFVTLRSERARRSLGAPVDSVEYLAEGELVVAADELEAAVDSLMSVVLSRLSARRVPAGALGELWAAVEQERQDRGYADWRRAEACLGLDPGEVDASEFAGLVTQGAWLGDGALQEVLCASEFTSLRAHLEFVKHASTSPDFEIDLSGIRLDSAIHALDAGSRRPLPWEEGQAAARSLRAQLGVDLGPLEDKDLERLFGVRVVSARAGLRPFAVGFVSDANPDVFAVTHGPSRRRTSARFEFARLVGDRLMVRSDDRVSPAVDRGTARQKRQRAFAQELLCPVDGLRAFLGPRLPEPSEDDLEDAAGHFKVSERLVRTALVNHGLVGRSGYADELGAPP